MKRQAAVKQMEILHRAAQLEGAQHVAFDVEVAGEIGVADAALVQAGDGRTPFLFLRVTWKLGVPWPKRWTAPSGMTTSKAS